MQLAKSSRGLCWQALRFGLVGLLNTAVGGGAIFIFQYSGMNPYFANLFGYCLGMVLSFILNRNWTFKSDLMDVGRKRSFILVVCVSYSLNFLTLALAEEIFGMSEVLSQLPAMVIYSIANFFGQRNFVFVNKVRAKNQTTVLSGELQE